MLSRIVGVPKCRFESITPHLLLQCQVLRSLSILERAVQRVPLARHCFSWRLLLVARKQVDTFTPSKYNLKWWSQGLLFSAGEAGKIYKKQLYLGEVFRNLCLEIQFLIIPPPQDSEFFNDFLALNSHERMVISGWSNSHNIFGGTSGWLAR